MIDSPDKSVADGCGAQYTVDEKSDHESYGCIIHLEIEIDVPETAESHRPKSSGEVNLCKNFVLLILTNKKFMKSIQLKAQKYRKKEEKRIPQCGRKT